MVNFDNFGGLTPVLKFHIFLIFNCEELVRIRAICEGLVRFFFRGEKLVLNFHKCEESVPNAHRCEKSNQSFADVKKNKVPPILV